MIHISIQWLQALEEEEKMTEEELAIKNVGKQDPKRHLGEEVSVSFQIVSLFNRIWIVFKNNFF